MNTKDNGNPGKRLLGFFFIINLLPVAQMENTFSIKWNPSDLFTFRCGYRSTEKIRSQREKIIAENL